MTLGCFAFAPFTHTERTRCHYAEESERARLWNRARGDPHASRVFVSILDNRTRLRARSAGERNPHPAIRDCAPVERWLRETETDDIA